MITRYSDISIASFVTAGFAALLALLILKRRRVPGSNALALLMGAIAVWIFARGLEAAAVEMPWKVFWAKVEYPGIVSIPVLWVIFIYQYTRRDRWLSPLNTVALWIIPAVSVALAATNRWHGLMWSRITPRSRGETELLIYTHGPWFWVLAAYSYALMLIGTLQLLKVTYANIRIYRVQSISILIAVMIPWAANGSYLSGHSPVPGMDLTPFAFLITGFVVAWSMVRHRLLNIVPMARGLLFENMEDGFILLDARDRIADINPAARGILDTRPGPVIGTEIGKFLPALSDLESWGSQGEIALEGEAGPLFFDCKMTPLHDRHGNRTGRLIVLRDISRRKQAEAGLQESRERYRQLVKNAPTGIYEIDFQKDRFISVNDVACEYTGYSRGELLSMSLPDILTEESREVFLQRLNRIFSGETVPETVEYTIRRKDGSKIWVILNTRVVYDEGRPKGATVVVHNITERKLAEEALRESEEKYRLLVENASEAIFIAQDEVIKFPNPRTTEMVGYDAQELAEIPFIRLIHPDDREMVIGRHRGRLRGAEPPRSYSFRIMGKSGEELWIELNTVLITWEGRPATLNFLRDITLQRELEAQLLRAQKMEAIGTMASGIAHNFRNILAAISVQMQVIDMKYGKDPALKGVSRTVADYVERGAQLVSSMTHLSRKSGEKKFHRLNLDKMAKEAYQIISESFDKMIHIHMDAQTALPIMGDYSGISQVLMNICTNARDAMPQGGELHIKAFKENGHAVVLISDTGQGMDGETQKRCFDPFFTTKDTDKGTGLGLSTAFGIMKEHGGRIEVHSEPGQGTSFGLYFPLAPPDTKGMEEPSTEIIQGTGQKILIVDDEIEICKVMAELVEMLGYQGAYASSGKEALEKFRTWHPDAVLLDRSMPDMDGLRSAEKMVDLDPDARIIIISGYEEDGPSGIGMAAKKLIKGYLTKPIDMGKLSRMLAGILILDDATV